MSKDRSYLLCDGVLIDAHNLNETASHCWARNRYLHGLASTAIAARECLLDLVLERIACERYELGQMIPVYNAWFVVDPYRAENAFPPPGIDEHQPIRFEVNFFVRPGREPILRDAAELRVHDINRSAAPP